MSDAIICISTFGLQKIKVFILKKCANFWDETKKGAEAPFIRTRRFANDS